MRMVPMRQLAEIESSGEKKFFGALEKLDWPNWVCLHSVFLAEHDYQNSGEIDFLLLGPYGIFVLEIKGGRVHVDEKHIWVHTNRFGKETRKGKSPFKQAHDNMHSLINDMAEQKKTWRNLRFGYGVVFPDIKFDLQSTEWVDEHILDATDMKSSQTLEDAMHSLITYWRNKNFVPDLDAEEIQEIVEFLRPRFDRVISLRTQLDQVKSETFDLTREQYRILDMLELNDRIICQGGAGTGKTFLALEFARRSISSGRRTLLTAHSPILAAYMKRHFSFDGLEILSFDEVNSGEKFDSIIIDEGQDLMNQNSYLKLDQLLVNGVKFGNWTIFLDINSQADVVAPVDRQVLSSLRSLSVSVKLDRNCRNTMPIITQIQSVTGADLEDAKIALGPLVEYEGVDNDRESEVVALVVWLKKVIRDERVKPGEVTILAVDDDLSWMDYLSPNFRQSIAVVDKELVLGWPIAKISAATTKSFKGLENDAIAILGLGGLADDISSRNRMYVAMSRARALLWVAVPKSIGPDLSEKWKLV